MYFFYFRKANGTINNGIEIIEQDVTNGNAVMASKVSVETENPKKLNKTLNISTLSHTKVQNKNNPGNEKKLVWFSHAKHFLLTQIQTFLKSKAPIYLLSAVYLVICLLGNIVTGIILVKHHFASHDEVEGINNLTQDIFSQIEARNNETMVVDSESDFDLSQMEVENSLDQQLLYLNISNDTVRILLARSVLVLTTVHVFLFPVVNEQNFFRQSLK